MLVDLGYAAAWYVVFIISVTIHEAAHAWAAKKGGDLTAYLGGQVSLNPLPHIKREPLGMVIFPLISAFVFGWPFGYAKTPYDPTWAYNHPRRAAWMSAAGPLANLSLMLLSALLIKTAIALGIFVEPDSVNFTRIVSPDPQGNWTGLSVFISMLFSMNLILVVLNLIPLPPLDGSGVVTLLLPDNASRTFRSAVRNPVFGFIGLIIAWQLFTPLFKFVFPAVMNLLYWGAGFHF